MSRLSSVPVCYGTAKRYNSLSQITEKDQMENPFWKNCETNLSVPALMQSFLSELRHGSFRSAKHRYEWFEGCDDITAHTR